MKLLEALAIVRQPPAENRPPVKAFLACGFHAADFSTYLAAHARLRLAGRPAHIAVGLFGDLAGSLERLPAGTETVFVALEWSDLDPRLGWRSQGDWNPETLPETLASARSALARLSPLLAAIAVPVTLALPTLPLPPLFIEPPEQGGTLFWELSAALATFAAGLPKTVRVLHPEALAAVSPAPKRLDLRADLATGFPYTGAHADALAALLAATAFPDPPRKGLITDLDDTLWKGILGEDGPEGIGWDLDHHAQLHGLYQKTLASLAASGILLAVASKNDPRRAAEALARKDLLVPGTAFYPVEAHWHPKSESVARILKAWNIAADAVVFVDDSPMELAEVAQSHPGIETLLFPKNEAAAAAELLRTLRRRFGKQRISEEDRLRAGSLRNGAPPPGDFLAEAAAKITFVKAPPPDDARPLELVNKTNQFNLNGVRYSPAEWSSLTGADNAFQLVVSYTDRFGPLGRIAVLAGRRSGGTLNVGVWVMSCRAFSRRIEHQCLKYLFDTFGADAIDLQYAPTERNGPLRDFFRDLTGAEPTGPFRLTREAFLAGCPPLHHETEAA